MTSQKDQIQALITDIDGVLQKTTPRLPWVVSGEVTQQRQMLERVRNYLVTYQRQQIVGESYGQAGARPDLLAHDIYYQPAQPSYQSPAGAPQAERSQAYSQSELSAQQMLQAIVQDMGYLRANVMQPLQADLELLRQQRESLAQEVRQLEAQRQSYAGQLPGNQQQVIAEFLQALMSRLQETLPQQVAQTLRSSQQSLPYSGDLALSGGGSSGGGLSGGRALTQGALNSIAQGLGNIQVPQSEADELLIKLDSTLSVVFESLQRNVQAYEESLSQGLDKMHSMGQQGEMMFTALISHLANQLGHEASSYLQPPGAKGLESARLTAPATGATAPGVSQATQRSLGSVNSSLLEQPNAELEQPAGAASQSLKLPFPGTEISSIFAETGSNRAEPSVDTAIDSWLRSASGVDATPAVDFELAELNLEGFDLNQLEAQDVNALLELDANLLSTNLPPQPLLAPTEATAAPSQAVSGESASGAIGVEDTADIDAALQLLEQLSSELQEQPASVADADAQIDRMLSTPSALSEEATAPSIPDDARDELDEFYESLFGNDAIATEPPLATPAATAATNTTDQASALPAVGPALAIAPLATQTAQPIDALPAETQVPTGALAAPEMATPPAVSAAVDPTLGWDLLAKPSSNQATEPDIPAALLEDELLSGWDFEDAEMGLSESELGAVGSELLGVSAPPAPIDHDPPPVPVPDNADRSDTLLPDLAPTAALADSPDEINTLADLFDETPPAEALEAPIAPLVSTEGLSQPEVSLPADTALTAPARTEQASAAPADDRLGDDRYTPALPEEDLLPLEEPADEADSELWLDESTLTRLSEDLFNLEETIAEPSILPFDTEPDTDAPALYPDAAASSEATLQSADESLSLDDWSTSLNEFADGVAPADLTPYPAEPEGSAIAAEPPEAFVLEGMDDLFADVPVVPPVTPVPPPVASTQAESSSAFTLEGMDDLFGEALTGATPLPPTSFPETDQSPPFTLEGIDDLFNDMSMGSSTPLPSAPESRSDPSLPFTLEGVDELFADAPPVAAPPVAATPVSDSPLAADGPSAAPETVTTGWPSQSELASSEPAFSNPASDFTLETGDRFVPAPTAGSLPPDSVPDAAIASLAADLPDKLPESIAPFTFEQVGDLFMEVPSAAGSPHEQAIHEPSSAVFSTAEQQSEPTPEPALAPFTLERVGDVFMEIPSEAVNTDSLTTSNPPAPSAPPGSEPSTLEQAFASLMGSFDEPLLAADGTEPDTHDPEKKK